MLAFLTKELTETAALWLDVKRGNSHPSFC